MPQINMDDTAFDNLRAEAHGCVAATIQVQLDELHGPGHSIDWVYGYWQACRDIAGVFGVTLDEPAIGTISNLERKDG